MCVGDTATGVLCKNGISLGSAVFAQHARGRVTNTHTYMHIYKVPEFVKRIRGGD